jgi:hypothetical protein
MRAAGDDHPVRLDWNRSCTQLAERDVDGAFDMAAVPLMLGSYVQDDCAFPDALLQTSVKIEHVVCPIAYVDAKQDRTGDEKSLHEAL